MHSAKTHSGVKDGLTVSQVWWKRVSAIIATAISRSALGPSPRKPRGLEGRILAVSLSLLTSLLTAVTPLARAQTLTTLYSFGGTTDGSNPHAGLVRNSKGNLYGTTVYGGADNFGVVFEIAGNGSGEKVLLSFYGGGFQGAYPYAGLVRDAKGSLYGTASAGGSYVGVCSPDGCGTVFKLAPSGALYVLHSFAGPWTDGATPYGGLVRDAKGNLLGTTYRGGAGGGAGGDGTVFEVYSSGAYGLAYFGGSPDGALPHAGLIVDSKGNFYGTTEAGGENSAGTVFELTSTGTEKVLYSFTASFDGAAPKAGLVRDAKGNLYGTTSAGGAYDSGVVFKVTPAGVETVLYNFSGGADGGTPVGGLVRDSKGNLYGTTVNGGAGDGTVFKVTPAGKETVLHSFMGGLEGANPYAGLIRDKQGNLYGTTYNGGYAGAGTVFVLAP